MVAAWKSSSQMLESDWKSTFHRTRSSGWFDVLFSRQCRWRSVQDVPLGTFPLLSLVGLFEFCREKYVTSIYGKRFLISFTVSVGSGSHNTMSICSLSGPPPITSERSGIRSRVLWISFIRQITLLSTEYNRLAWANDEAGWTWEFSRKTPLYEVGRSRIAILGSYSRDRTTGQSTDLNSMSVVCL